MANHYGCVDNYNSEENGGCYYFGGYHEKAIVDSGRI